MENMLYTGTNMVVGRRKENLGFMLESPKGRRMENRRRIAKEHTPKIVGIVRSKSGPFTQSFFSQRIREKQVFHY